MSRLRRLSSLLFASIIALGSLTLSANALAVTIFVEAEDYNLGGEGVGYHDSDSVRNGNYNNGRGEYVDLSALTAGGGEANTGDNPPSVATVSYVIAGEWLDYDVNVPVAGLYKLDIRNSSQLAGTRYLHFEIDGSDITGPVAIASTGKPWRYATNTKSGIALPAGDITLRLFFD